MALELRPYTKKANVYRLHVQDSPRPPPPSMLKYSWDASQLIALDTTAAVSNETPVPSAVVVGWTNEPIDEQTKLRLLPVSQKPEDWRLLLVMKRLNGDTIWLKSAFINTTTGKVALLTAANSDTAIINNGNRAIKSHDPVYHVGRYTMLAPLFFWKELILVLMTEHMRATR